RRRTRNALRGDTAIDHATRRTFLKHTPHEADAPFKSLETSIPFASRKAACSDKMEIGGDEGRFVDSFQDDLVMVMTWAIEIDDETTTVPGIRDMGAGKKTRLVQTARQGMIDFQDVVRRPRPRREPLDDLLFKIRLEYEVVCAGRAL